MGLKEAEHLMLALNFMNPAQRRNFFRHVTKAQHYPNLSIIFLNRSYQDLFMGYGYGMTADLIGFARAKKHGITLNIDQLDAIVTMIKKGEI